MLNRSYCSPNKLSQNYQSNDSANEYNRCKLPAINNGTIPIANMNSTFTKSPLTDQYATPMKENNSTFNNSNCNTENINNRSSQVFYTPSGPAVSNACTPSYNNAKINCSPRSIAPSQTFSSSRLPSKMCNNKQQIPMNRAWNSNKMNTTTIDTNKNCFQRPMTSGPNGLNCSSSNGQKTIVRDRNLATEILQKAGITSNSTPNDCLEVITDTPVTMNDNVNCDPNPLCMKKTADCQECYEQSIVVRHLQPPKPPVPPPIIIRERCAPQPPPQPPIVIRQTPPRPLTPPPLIIRECPPPMPDSQEPTIIEREVPPPPPPPRQVIVERLPTPPPKPRPIIFEKWLPYEEPEDRPCIVEKACVNEMPPPKNVIIQYEALEPRIQPQCINEGISYVDPKQFINDRPNGNAEICYVDQLNNLPDHIKCQLSPQTLAAIGIQNNNNNPCIVRTNPSTFYQQNGRVPCNTIPSMPPKQSMITNGCQSTKPSYSQLCNPNICHQQQSDNRALSTSGAGLSQCYNKYNTKMLTRPGNQALTNLTRAHYNPWATTYQVSYTNKARGMCRAR
ncbi:unnamed protein product [Adineta steineri]|uniref:Uncharacterized protein n=1 Tax=Adineta steineri TaxID=433720 RepID=A0A815AQN1_9BILA|nr:unnamed protein product [Adineta steineri]CAF1260271.1 unnamed protein product [Adineta steineri]